MTKIVAYMPTYAQIEAQPLNRLYSRLPQEEILDHLKDGVNMNRPGMYFDAVDSILNISPDIKLVIADGRSTDSVRDGLFEHHKQNKRDYVFYPYEEKLSQWWIFNDVIKNFVTYDTEYFIYSSSDVIWTMNWVSEAIKEFEKNPKLQILFPTMSNGDRNCACQIANGVQDKDPFVPPYQQAAKAPVLNAYVMIFRMDFLRTYGGYPTAYRNCYTESFLWYLCEAVAGQMMVLPRGHCFHWDGGDKWSENGSTYYYNEEYEKFEGMMNRLQFARGIGKMDIHFLKKMLYV